MGVAIAAAVAENGGKFDGHLVVKHFLKWSNSNPKDIGNTTKKSLDIASKSGEWYAGGLACYNDNPGNAANGSVMRNGVVAALFPHENQEIECLDATIMHGIITHFGPLPVLSCVLHTLVIRHALLRHENRAKISSAPKWEDIEAWMTHSWTNYKKTTSNSVVKLWLSTIGDNKLKEAEGKFLEELKDFENYNPFEQDESKTGYCVTVVKICLWALHWSFRSDHPPTIPSWLPPSIFQHHGFDTVMWVVCVGADADTYGATAGAVLAAYHQEIKPQYIQALFLKDKIQQTFLALPH